MRIGKRWAGCLAAGLFLLCAAGLLWLLGAETVPRQEPARLTPEAVSGAPGLDGLYLAEAFHVRHLGQQLLCGQPRGKTRLGPAAGYGAAGGYQQYFLH